jgi:ubiquinone/menaquinone biosynthesis C-methylase UbiE
LPGTIKRSFRKIKKVNVLENNEMDNDTDNIEVEMIERFVSLKDQKVLEIGCGEGRLSALLASKPETYIAIDPDEQSIEKAKSEIPNVKFKIGSGEALEFEDVSFSVILFTLSLHHQDSHLALKEAHRVLTETGKLIILEPVASGELTQFFSLFDDETERLLETLNVIENCDFEIEHKELFSTLMTFTNQEELYDYDFDQDKNLTENRDRIIKLLYQLKGPMAADQPIQLEDDMHIFLLKKRLQ